MRPEVADWFARRTWQPAPWSAADLVAAKAGRRVSVVLPALDEEGTVGHVVEALRPLTVPAAPGPGAAGGPGGALVDEIVVLDGGSTDRTAVRARAAGARVVTREEALPHVPVRPGKGEVLWRSLAATSGDLIVFVDADLVDVESSLVVSLLGPLLTDPGVQLVKGFYRRPLRLETSEADTGGGRVTELVARPVLARFAPELSGVVQPLGGEYAATRRLLESVPLAGSYGVEVALLLDTLSSCGLDAIAQVDLGVRKHRNRTLLDLGVMAQEVLDTVLRRVPPGGTPAAGGTPSPGANGIPHPGANGGPDVVDQVELVQFVQVAGRWEPRSHVVRLADRPPMALVRQRGITGDGDARPADRGSIVR